MNFKKKLLYMLMYSVGVRHIAMHPSLCGVVCVIAKHTNFLIQSKIIIKLSKFGDYHYLWGPEDSLNFGAGELIYLFRVLNLK